MAERISLFNFAEFVGGSVLKKVSVANTVATSTPYDPATDWWKKLRELIPQIHREGLAPNDLLAAAGQVTDRKLNSYANRAQAYVNWWGNRNIVPFKGQPARWSSSGIDVTVNPELFVAIDGTRHVVKLFFRGSGIAAERILVVLRLMELMYRNGDTPRGRPAVGLLDLSSGGWHVPVESLAYLDPVLRAEAASLATLLEAP